MNNYDLHCAPCYRGYPGQCAQNCMPGCDGRTGCTPATRALMAADSESRGYVIPGLHALAMLEARRSPPWMSE